MNHDVASHVYRPFRRILIANRGEIACRVIRAARAAGLETVAVYSDADRDSLYVSMADQSIYIGASPATSSYLNIDSICHAIKKAVPMPYTPATVFSQKILSSRRQYWTVLRYGLAPLLNQSVRWAIRQEPRRSCLMPVCDAYLAMRAGINLIRTWFGKRKELVSLSW